MTDLRKAAEMALEALEWINRVNAMDYEYQRKAGKPIQALRQALAQPPVDWEAVAADQAMTIAMSKIEKREWVGLTRRELDIATLGLEDLGDCYMAIEAKLKEKNA